MSLTVGYGTSCQGFCITANSYIEKNNAASASGVITSFKGYFGIASTGVVVGAVYGSGTSFTSRGSTTLGSVSAGLQTFTGLSIPVTAGDFLAIYVPSGYINYTNAVAATNAVFRTGTFVGSQTYSTSAYYHISMIATGVTAAAVTTNTATSVTTSGCTGNGNITDTGGSGSDVTRRGFCWMAGTSGDPTTANNVSYDDGSFSTGAFTKNITGMSAGTSYRVRSYVVNAYGTFYGSSVTVLTLPAAPTGVSATENNSSKITITWTKSTGATGYKIYRDDSLIDTVGDVATYDDTGAAAPVITPGSAVASDGTSQDYVALTVTGASVANGTSYSYTVKATNDSGESAASSADTGYRAAGSLTYQWQRSAADGDADYSDISGGTTASYNDTGISSVGSGRYYKCVLSSTGATTQTSAADRGYRYTAGLFTFLG